MNNIEFGKEIQKLSKYFNEITGETLNIKIDEETEVLSSKVYSGNDYPKDRKILLQFLRKKIIDYFMKDKIVFIDPIITSKNAVHSAWVHFKLNDKRIVNFDLLYWHVFPIDILSLYINYLKGVKDYTISVWEEEDGPYIFKIFEDKTYLCLSEEIHDDDYILIGTPNEQAKEFLSHFKKYLAEWENGCDTKGKIAKLCEELESLLK